MTRGLQPIHEHAPDVSLPRAIAYRLPLSVVPVAAPTLAVAPTPLVDALAACATGDERRTYLAGLSAEQRQTLSDELAYRSLTTPSPEECEFEAF